MAGSVVHSSHFAPLVAAVAPSPGGNVVAPVMILVLCVIAGIGTLLLLPSRREAVVRKIGGTILLAAGLIFAALLLRYAAGARDSAGKSLGGGMSLYFWIFSAIAIVGAIRVITHPRPVYSALYFVMTVMASAGLFILLWAEFMAAALVIIYAGAILVTYVFVIMLASQSSPTAAGAAEQNGDAGLAEYDRVSREPMLASAIGFALMGVLLFVIFDRAPEAGHVTAPAGAGRGHGTPGTVQALGEYLFKNQLVNLELAGLILTIAMIGAILIARRRVELPARTTIVGPVETTVAPATPIDDNPHSIPVYGTQNPRAKAYPQA